MEWNGNPLCRPVPLFCFVNRFFKKSRGRIALLVRFAIELWQDLHSAQTLPKISKCREETQLPKLALA